MKTHQFQSITEQQWKSGLSRHKCALCSYDYSDPVHSVSNWPLVLIIEDCYVPETAGPLLRALYKLDDESAAVSIKLYAMDAEQKLTKN